MLQKYRGEIILFIVSLIAASGWFFSKFSMAEFPALGFIGLRFFLAAIFFFPLAYPQLKRLDKPQLIKSALVGLCYAVYIMLWMLGLINSAHFGEGAFLVSLSMLIAPLLSWLIFGHLPYKSFWLALPAAFTGLYLLSSGKGGLHFSFGSLIFLISSLVAALYFVLNNQYARDIPVLSFTTIQLFIVGTCCGTLSILFEQWPTSISMTAWGWFLCSLVIATNLRMLLQTYGQKYCHVATAAIIMILEPVWTLFFSILILGERLTLHKAFGCLSILAAIMIYRLPAILRNQASANKE
ncbi:DMT family transporter [[Mannheimia] succiniciproducens]|uniref:RhaT protein n=1 Tax=Mannheimia succiniciproducens (strain KCTC 0769BP / MBEL55E) TaxID=221988 RepID=Q65V68_MANSM|nr:DMT family transporter [[Mannheimia] succiniciproducens]AAU37142.1 RhaT protein [[Mannheimia] succiniciproducens MBEL55E]